MAGAAALCASPAAGIYTGIGSGVIHSNGAALHIAVPIYRHIEAHYSLWHDGPDADRAAGIGYRFESRKPVSLVVGVAYMGRVSRNLLRRADAYVELRVGPFDNFSCQLSHYSSVGDDKGENLLLCGWQWDWPGGGRTAE